MEINLSYASFFLFCGHIIGCVPMQQLDRSAMGPSPLLTNQHQEPIILTNPVRITAYKHQARTVSA